jgi:hypothetical protein
MPLRFQLIAEFVQRIGFVPKLNGNIGKHLRSPIYSRLADENIARSSAASIH